MTKTIKMFVMMSYMFLFGAFISSLPTLLLSIKRMLTEKDGLTMLLVLVSMMLTATYISAMFYMGNFLSVAALARAEMKLAFSPSLVFCLWFVVALGLNGIMFMFVKNVKKDNLWKLVAIFCFLFLTGCLLVGIIGSQITGMSIDNCFFATCCGVMGVSGVAWGLSYKEICVIGNIYIESGICMMSALWLVFSAVQRFVRKQTVVSGVVMALSVVCGLLCVGAFILICQHYAMPMNDAFDLCYNELVQSAKEYNTTYNNVNYLIFIILPVVLITGNLLMAKIVRCFGIDDNEA